MTTHARLAAAALALALSATAGATAAEAAGPGALQANLASAGANTRLFGAAVQSDGRVVAVGESGVTSGADVLVARYTTTGALDGSFGSGGVAHGPGMAAGDGSVGRAVAIQPDGKIVVVGKISGTNSKGAAGVLVERYNANGGLDSGFGSGGVVKLFTDNNEFGDGYGVAVQPDGKIIVSGAAQAAGSGGTTPRVAIARLNTNGSPDSSFAGGGQEVIDDGAYSNALAVALQSDGKIVFGGSQSPNGQVVNALVGRLTSTGHPDSSFNGTGAYAHQYAKAGAASSAFNAVAIGPGGQIVAAGAATDGNSSADSIVARFNSNGSVDGSFGAGGVVYTQAAQNLLIVPTPVPGANGVVVAANGNIVTAGSAANGIQVNAVLHAYGPSGAPLSAFGSGGTVSTSAASNNSEDAGLAIAADGTLAAVGDTSSMASTGYASSGALYGGVGAPATGSIAFKVTLSGVSRNYKIKTVSRKGVGAQVGCNQACTLRVKLVASATTAKQLKLGGKRSRRCTKHHGKRTCRTTIRYRAVTVGSASGRLGGAGGKHFVLKLTSRARKAISTQKRVKLTLQATGVSTSSHQTKSASKTLTLKR